MSGTLTRPDWAADIKDLQRRIGILERRVTPQPAPPVDLVPRSLLEVVLWLGPSGFFPGPILLPDPVSSPTASYPIGSICSAPVTILGAASGAQGWMYPSANLWYPEGAAVTVQMYLTVWNPGVTQRLRVFYEDTITGGGWSPTSHISTDEAIGSDLSMNAGTVRSAAGGIYFASLVTVVTAWP